MAGAKRFVGDSFVVDVTPPGKKEPYFPMVTVHRRKSVRKHGAVARGKELLIDGLPEPPSQRQLATLARKIGEAILAGSPITRRWMRGTWRP